MAATKGTTAIESRGKRRPIFPANIATAQEIAMQRERTQALWPWYFVPFYEPDVSPECRAFVLGEYQPEDDEEKAMLLAELSSARTIRSDTRMAVIQAPGACAAERSYYQRKGFRLISPVAGETGGGSGQDFLMWPPHLDDGHMINGMLTDPYIGINTVIADLTARQKWALAQLQAKIDVTTDLSREGDGQSKRYHRNVVSRLKARYRIVENGIPTVKEMQAFFLRFERLRLQSQQDARLKEQQALQQRVDNLGAQEQAVMNEINAGVEADWSGGVPEPVGA